MGYVSIIPAIAFGIYFYITMKDALWRTEAEMQAIRIAKQFALDYDTPLIKDIVIINKSAAAETTFPTEQDGCIRLFDGGIPLINGDVRRFHQLEEQFLICGIPSD